MGATHLCILSVVVLLQFCVGPSLACNGFNIRLNEINNCAGPDQVITIDSNSTIKLTEDCQLIIVGCTTTTGFEKADVKYKVTKKGLPPISGQREICGEVSKFADELAPLAAFGIPTACPVAANRICSTADHGFDVSMFKSYLGMARGQVDVDLDIEHDKGKSCIKIKGELFKEKKN